MIRCTRRIQFCAGHRVHGHEGKCRHLHGHNYIVFLTAEAESLDLIGRVIDFGVLKDRIGRWIDDHWDHGFLVWEKDTDAIAALSWMKNQKTFHLPNNPTAENMAEYLLWIVGPEQLADTSVRIVRVVVWETENCHAEAAL